MAITWRDDLEYLETVECVEPGGAFLAWLRRILRRPETPEPAGESPVLPAGSGHQFPEVDLATAAFDLQDQRDSARGIAVGFEQENAHLLERMQWSRDLLSTHLCECRDYPNDWGGYGGTDLCDRCFLLSWLTPPANPAQDDIDATLAPF